MELSRTSQAVIRKFVQENAALRNELAAKAEAKHLLFAVNSGYAYLVDMFNHLERLAQLDLSDSKANEKSFVHAAAAISAALKAQYYIKSPLNYHTSESVEPFKNRYYDDIDQADKVIAGFIQTIVTKYLKPAFSEEEIIELARTQHACASIYFNDSLSQRKPQGMSLGFAFEFWGPGATNLLRVHTGLAGVQVQGDLQVSVPAQVWSECADFMASTYANLVDSAMIYRGESSFPSHGKISLGYDIANANARLSAAISEGDSNYTNFRASYPDVIRGINETMQRFFKTFFDLRIRPHLTNDQIAKIRGVHGSFSFQPSQAGIAARQ
ncbi:MAG: hypothetical protein OXU45_05970 [Candidatus Melainabacteria bacterium]|nr:hypothetical protein [Candidatus Melainabacteria bacterium]